jgi:hypothetical protein
VPLQKVLIWFKTLKHTKNLMAAGVNIFADVTALAVCRKIGRNSKHFRGSRFKTYFLMSQEVQRIKFISRKWSNIKC